jgi:nicotinamide-nucleotide amidase
MPTAQVVSVGWGGAPTDDLVSAVAAWLEAAGLAAVARVFIEDDEAALDRALQAEVGLTVIVAGPGGSALDAVRRALARLAGVRLVPSAQMAAALAEASRPDDRLALLPEGAVVWSAPGAEPAWVLEAASRAFAVLPRGAGSHEARLAAFARARAAGPSVAMRTLRVVGPSLGEVDERLADWRGSGAPGAVEVTTLGAEGEVWVRLRVRGGTPATADQALTAAEARIVERLGLDCYGRDADALERVVGRLLAERGLTLAVAESCTGGLLGHRLTSVPGSSRYFERGVMVYSNRAKEELLGVPADVLRDHGAVSAPCAEAMALGVRRLSGSDCALAVTGIAGPDGGTPAKPTGTVFVGVAVGERITAHRFQFSGDRAAVKWQSAHMALDLLRRRLLGPPP